LTASDGAQWDKFGWSVAVSGDHAVVGAQDHAPDGANRSGAAYLFRRRGGTWEPAGKLLQDAPVVNDEFGCAVALEGNTVLVGASHNDWVSIVWGVVTDGGSVYEFQPYLFIDGFESGDTSEWSSAVP
jgi:hypothetical protein